MHPISELLCRAYNDLAARDGIEFPLGVVHARRIDTIVKTVYGTFYGRERYPTDATKAAAFFYYIIKNHPLTDGNKRLAVLWLEILSNVHGLVPRIEGRTGLDELAISVENSQISHDEAIDAIATVLGLTDPEADL